MEEKLKPPTNESSYVIIKGYPDGHFEIFLKELTKSSSIQKLMEFIATYYEKEEKK